MKHLNKVAALGLAVSMVLGSSVMVLAEDVTSNVAAGDEKEITGTGVESYVNKNVMKVTLPTLANVFNYKVDPQGLVAETKSFDGVAVESVADSGVLFKNTDAAGKVTASNTSDAVTITNKSSIPVEIGVKAKLTAASGGLALSTLADSADFTTDNNKTKALYIGLIPTNDSEKALSGDDASADNILLSGADQYETKNTSGSSYTYAEKADAEFPEFSFYLTGAINKDLAMTTWATVANDGTVTTKNPPTVSVKFTLTKVEDALEAGAILADNGDLYIWKANAEDLTKDGGFGETKPTTVKVNGVAVSAVADNVLGYGVVEFAKIAARFGYTDVTKMTDEEKAAVKGYVKSVTVTAGGLTYYGEL